MGYLLFCGYYFFRPFRAPPAVLCASGYLLERFLRAKGELRKRKDRCGGGTMHMSPYVSVWPNLARCTKKDILLFCVIECIFPIINQESRG